MQVFIKTTIASIFSSMNKEHKINIAAWNIQNIYINIYYIMLIKIIKNKRFKNIDDFTASLAWSTCNSAGVSPEKKIGENF